MKSDRIMDAFGLIDDELIEEAASFREKKTPVRANRRRLRLAALAACLLIAVVGGNLVSGQEQIEKESVYSPWIMEEELETLPVFKNSAYYGHGGSADGLSEEEMEARLYRAAEALGVEITQIERLVDEDWETFRQEGDLAQYDGLISMTAEAGDIKIEIERNGTTYISSQAVSAAGDERLDDLPADYPREAEDASEEQAQALLDSLMEKYSALFGYENPKAYTFLTKDTDINGKRDREFAVYDGGGSYEESLLNYSLRRAEFNVIDGRLHSIRFWDYRSVLQELGEYSVVPLEKAVKRLMDGEYLSASPFGDFEFARKDVESVDLVYLVNTGADYVIPFYQFNVAYEDESLAENVEWTVPFCVPAVEAGKIVEETIENWQYWG